MSPQQSVPQSRGNRKTLIIGFDFGTHSTKVVVRERGISDGRIVRFDQPAQGYPTYASPSVVRLVDGQLYFGTTALNTPGGELYESLKVSLLSDTAHNAGCALDKRDLVAAYLAWALQQVRNTVVVDEYTNVFLNVAAPMSHVEDQDLKIQYLRIVHAAWNLTFHADETRIEHGIPASKVANILRPLKYAPVPSSEERRFDVLPETVAPIVSLSLDPLMKPSIYVVVDMGAGTTEMSVFHAGDSKSNQRILCYKDKTFLIGGNDLQHAKRSVASGLGDGVLKIIDRIENEYRDIWRSGYSVDADEPLAKRRWKDLIVVLSGGGTRHPDIAQRLQTSNPVPYWKDHKGKFEVRRHVPGTLVLPQNMSKDDRSLFAVANGLSIERVKWPKFHTPDEIEPMTAPEPDPPKPDYGYRPRWV